MNKTSNTKTVMFQGIECYIGYKAIHTHNYLHTNLDSWFSTKLPIEVKTNVYQKQGFYMCLDSADEKLDGANVYTCYMPVKLRTRFGINNDSREYYEGDVIYVSSDIADFDSSAPQNITYHDINKNWNLFSALERHRIIRYRPKDLDVEKHWEMMSDVERRKVIQYQIYNFDVEKHWYKLMKHEKTLVCIHQIYNFAIRKHWGELEDFQKRQIYTFQSFNLDIDLCFWNDLLPYIKEMIYFYYYKKIDIDYKKIDIDYKKVDGEWRVMLHPAQHREKQEHQAQ